ncbi:uncharacterized protein si:dkey-46i9.6, partial [Tachysurus ichikawai]
MDHRAHYTVPVEREWSDKKALLRKTEAEVQQMIRERLQKVEDIKHCIELNKHSALREIEDSVQVFSNLVRKVQKAQAELVIAIEEKQRKTAQWAQGLIEEIEREIVQLTKRNCEIDHLARTDDHIYFLQNLPSLITHPQTKDWSEAHVPTNQCLGTIRRAVSKLEETLAEEIEKLAETELKTAQKYSFCASRLRQAPPQITPATSQDYVSHHHRLRQSSAKSVTQHHHTMTDFTSRSSPCTSTQNAPESIMQYLKCSICMDVLKEPVTTNCGHTFCKPCLNRHMSTNNRVCPLCKSQLPELKVNIVLKEILKEIQKPMTRSPDEFTRRPGEVPCDVCNEDLKYKAVKSCLLCLLSFCKRHLKGHTNLHAKGHKLVAPMNDLNQWACSVHGMPLELYLVSEGKLICSRCVQGGANVVSVEEERDRKKAELETVINRIEQGRQQRMENAKKLDNSASNCLNLIDQETKEIKNVFSAIKKAIQKAEDKALMPLEDRRKQVEQSANDLRCYLIEIINALSKTISDLQTLRNEEDPVFFLQSYPCTTAVDDGSDWTSVSLDTELSFGTIRSSIMTMMEDCKDEFEKLSRIEISRIKKFGVNVTLDPDTANRQLQISYDMMQVDLSYHRHEVMNLNLSLFWVTTVDHPICMSFLLGVKA